MSVRLCPPRFAIFISHFTYFLNYSILNLFFLSTAFPSHLRRISNRQPLAHAVCSSLACPNRARPLQHPWPLTDSRISLTDQAATNTEGEKSCCHRMQPPTTSTSYVVQKTAPEHVGGGLAEFLARRTTRLGRVGFGHT